MPALVGVPEMTPVVALMVRPTGRPVADHANGVVPPVNFIASDSATFDGLDWAPGLVITGAVAACAAGTATNVVSSVATHHATHVVERRPMVDAIGCAEPRARCPT
ncbi:hypothetical protein GCM10023107_89420 [Actinoplanes octamycinicus]|nr:hypothetical protein Aoc01nite_64830 [Actinoplanes octamycinicus]